MMRRRRSFGVEAPRPQRLAMQLWVGGSLALAAWLAACLPLAGRGVEDMRTRLIGIEARTLRGCIGVPFDTTEDGDTEYLRYRWLEPESDPDPFDVSRGGSLDPLGSRRVGRQRDPTLSREVLDGSSSAIPRGVGYCELVFEIQSGRVRNVEVDARLPSGLNNNYRCIRMAEGCVPEG